VRGDREGWSDLSTTTRLMRFAFLANLTGHPALTVPVGEDAGLPLGLQLMGRAWDEVTLLRLGARVEAALTPPLPPAASRLLDA
jgi:aspartyl-tRNA(Asn)/glutamyl-tRNA(Gln) amidotransferase subunit A